MAPPLPNASLDRAYHARMTMGQSSRKPTGAMGRGGALLLRAADRCIPVAQDVGGVALLIDAKNDRAARWYGAMALSAWTMRRFSLVLPLATAADAVKRES